MKLVKELYISQTYRAQGLFFNCLAGSTACGQIKNKDIFFLSHVFGEVMVKGTGKKHFLISFNLMIICCPVQMWQEQ